MKRYVLCALAALSLCSCGPSDETSDEAALQTIEQHKDDLYLEKRESDICDAFLAIGNVVLQSSKTSPETIELKNKQLKERIGTIFRQNQIAAGREFNASPGLMQAEDLPDEMPRVYQVQALGAERVGDTQARYEVLLRTMESWHDAQNKIIDDLCRQLVPEYEFGLLNNDHSSPQSEAWMKLPRNQRKARLHVVELLKTLLRELHYYRESYENLFLIAPSYEQNAWDYQDHRRFRLLIQLNLSIDEMLSWLYTEFYPAPTLDYSLPEHLELSQLDFLGADSVEPFVDNIHQSLLRSYFFDESDQYKTADEVREEVEMELSQSMQLMKIAYKTQLELIREMMPLRFLLGDFPEDEVCDDYDQYVQNMESIFLDDINFVRNYADWIPKTDEEENEEFTIPSPAPDLVTPSFMLATTSCEGLACYMYRMAGDAQRAHVRKVFHMMCDESYDMTTGIAVPSGDQNVELQLKYIKSCMNDAEYAWEQYALSLRELIEPHLPMYRGSGTGNFISGYMSELYENHYNFYSSLLKISVEK